MELVNENTEQGGALWCRPFGKRQDEESSVYREGVEREKSIFSEEMTEVSATE